MYNYVKLENNKSVIWWLSYITLFYEQISHEINGFFKGFKFCRLLYFFISSKISIKCLKINKHVCIPVPIDYYGNAQ